MTEPKQAFKKSTFQSDREINDFHLILSSLLRWDLPKQQKEEHIANSIVGLEFFHSQALLNCVSSQDIYDVLLGDRLKIDPKYVVRLYQVQDNKELFARYQSISTSRKAANKYTKMLSELIYSFENPDNDDRLIDLKKILEKWVNA